MRPVKRLFTDHPESVGESWVRHFGVAFRFGLVFTGTGLACMVHALLPFLFVRTGSETVIRLHREMMTRRAPEILPDDCSSRDRSTGTAGT
ncbi:MAG: DUF6356 family protein [Parvibaculaceae bacterium]|nr:DUF6356 family protein [Parvibaculaceae bacterium]